MECEESEGRGLRRKGALAVHVDAERLWMACLTSSFDGLAAKPQFPHRMGFEGLIAFHPRTVEALTAQEMYLVAAHELGRLWGIEKHTKNIHSIMYFQNPNPYMVLDRDDVARLRAHHALATGAPPAPIQVVGRALVAEVPFNS